MPSHDQYRRLRGPRGTSGSCITGATGFVGEALLERLLFDLPDTPVTLLVRAAGSLTARRSGSSSCSPGRRSAGCGTGAATTVEPRRLDGHITVLEGDLDRGAAAARRPRRRHSLRRRGLVRPADRRGLRHQRARHAEPAGGDRRERSHPHYVHVSTAYVAGLQQGHIREGRLDHDVDWRSEAEAAALLRERVEIDSRAAAAAGEASAPRPRRSTDVVGRRVGRRPRPSGGGRRGLPRRWSTPGANAAAASAGPTATPSPRRWPSARSRRPRPTCR